MANTRGTEIDLGLLTKLAGSKANASRILNVPLLKYARAENGRPAITTDEDLLMLYTDGNFATGLRNGTFQGVRGANAGIGALGAEAIEKYLLERKMLAYDHRFQHLPHLVWENEFTRPMIVEIGELHVKGNGNGLIYTLGLEDPSRDPTLCYGTSREPGSNLPEDLRVNKLSDIVSYRTIAPFKRD